MLNKKLLDRKIPLVDDNHTAEDVLNYLVKTINSSFIKSSNLSSSSTDVIPSWHTNYVDLTFSFNTYSSIPITQNHNLGATPTGWIIIDQYLGGGSNDLITVLRVSWDAASITLKAGGLNGIACTCKIRVFL